MLSHMDCLIATAAHKGARNIGHPTGNQQEGYEQMGVQHRGHRKTRQQHDDKISAPHKGAQPVEARIRQNFTASTDPLAVLPPKDQPAALVHPSISHQSSKQGMQDVKKVPETPQLAQHKPKRGFYDSMYQPSGFQHSENTGDPAPDGVARHNAQTHDTARKRDYEETAADYEGGPCEPSLMPMTVPEPSGFKQSDGNDHLSAWRPTPAERWAMSERCRPQAVRSGSRLDTAASGRQPNQSMRRSRPRKRLSGNISFPKLTGSHRAQDGRDNLTPQAPIMWEKPVQQGAAIIIDAESVISILKDSQTHNWSFDLPSTMLLQASKHQASKSAAPPSSLAVFDKRTQELHGPWDVSPASKSKFVARLEEVRTCTCSYHDMAYSSASYGKLACWRLQFKSDVSTVKLLHELWQTRQGIATIL